MLTPPRIWYRVAAAVALVSIAGASAVLLLNGRDGAPPRTGSSSPPDSALLHPVQADRSLAGAFAPEPELEGLVNFRSRSGGITLFSPGIGAEVRGAVTFDWKGSAPALIEVYNNRKELQKTLRVRRPPAILAEQLPPGTYYWKLIAEEELLFVGKFTAR